MSAIAFSTKVEKETDDAGNAWVVITLRGKWSVFLVCFAGRFCCEVQSLQLDTNADSQQRLPFTRF